MTKTQKIELFKAMQRDIYRRNPWNSDAAARELNSLREKFGVTNSAYWVPSEEYPTQEDFEFRNIVSDPSEDLGKFFHNFS